MAKKSKPEIDIEKQDRYVSRRSEEELKAFQVKKSTFFMLSMTFLIIATFLPSDASWHDSHKSLTFWFSMLNIAGLIFVLYMLFQDNRKYKIQKVVLKSKAPRYGYDNKFTFVTCEVFTAVMLYFLVEQCVIVAFARDGFAIAGLCLMVCAFGFALVSRFILVKANSGYMDLIEVEPKSDGTETGKDTEPKDGENGTPNESVEDAAADDFYAPSDTEKEKADENVEDAK